MAKPTVISYCATFLKPEMLHVYRQISGVEAFTNIVATRRRENPILFPYPHLHVLKKNPLRALHRIYHRSCRQRVPVSNFETRQIDRLRDQYHASLVHIYFGTEASRLLDWIGRSTCPIIVSFHGADVSDTVDDADLFRIFSNSTLLLYRSESLRKALVQRGAPEEKLRHNPTAIPLPENHHPLSFIPNQPIRLLQACRFIEKKGLDTTLHAAKLLIDAGIPVELTLAGDGPLASTLHDLACQLGLGHSIRFTGFLNSDKLQQEYLSHHIFLHPSRKTSSGDREGIPNSLLEAMASCRLVIATRHSGIPEAVDHGENGILIDSSDPEPLANAIRSAISQPTNANRLALNARRTIQNKFSSGASIQRLETSYREAIQMSSRP